MAEITVDRYLPASVRTRLEQSYYARVSAQSTFEKLLHAAEFWQDPSHHPGIFSDHGVVHVRDVALQILRVVQAINGVLIPYRTPDELEQFHYGYGAMMAYLHDIGMADLSPFGRAMHPEYAAQALFSGELDDVIETLWQENSGQLRTHLTRLVSTADLQRSPQTILREALALTFAHSKSKARVTLLNDPSALREKIQFILSHTLQEQYRLLKAQPVPAPSGSHPQEQPSVYLNRYYQNFNAEAYDWLTSQEQSARAFASDVIDVIRALRCADALRQRGTVHKTSGGYEVFMSQQTGEAIYALRLGPDQLYLLELPGKPNNVGEANIASSELNRSGDLRISFHRGAYANPQALHRSASYTAYAINDFLDDIVDSFWRVPRMRDGALKTPAEIQILLESCDDNPAFSELVRGQLAELNPARANQLQVVPSLHNVSDLERTHYLAACDLAWSLEQRQAVLTKIAQSGQKTADIHPQESFKHVRLLELQAGATLIQAGAPASFVYFPLGPGLKVIPLGGYQPFAAAAWMPIGNTGVIRGAARNADVVAEQKLALLMIPKEVYLNHWYVPYSDSELKNLLFPP